MNKTQSFDLKSQLPHLNLNPISLKISTSYQTFEPENVFWEIVVKQLKLFDNKLNSESGNSEKVKCVLLLLQN